MDVSMAMFGIHWTFPLCSNEQHSEFLDIPIFHFFAMSTFHFVQFLRNLPLQDFGRSNRDAKILLSEATVWSKSNVSEMIDFREIGIDKTVPKINVTPVCAVVTIYLARDF